MNPGAPVRKTLLTVLATLLVTAAGAAAALYVAVSRSGLSARPEPSRTEARLARLARRLAIGSDVRRAVNPVPLTPEVLAEARAHFADHCASCHANDGSGDTQLGRRLYPRAPDMRLPDTQRLSDGELFYVIENGIRMTGMPGWGGAVRPEASWKLVHFIRHLPEITPAETLEMETLNPKTPAEWRELQADEEFLGSPRPDPAATHHAH